VIFAAGASKKKVRIGDREVAVGSHSRSAYAISEARGCLVRSSVVTPVELAGDPDRLVNIA
jgi:hypothetical protein